MNWKPAGVELPKAQSYTKAEIATVLPAKDRARLTGLVIDRRLSAALPAPREPHACRDRPISGPTEHTDRLCLFGDRGVRVIFGFARPEF
jgi:hypothetical protein